MFYIYVRVVDCKKIIRLLYPYKCWVGLFVESCICFHRDNTLLAAWLQHGALKQETIAC